MLLGKGILNSILVTFDNGTCSSDHAVMLWGDIGDWNGYQGDVGSGCDVGNDGSDNFFFSGDNVWFNLIWVNESDAAGHPGYTDGPPRTWTASGHCSVSADDFSDLVCD